MALKPFASLIIKPPLVLTPGGNFVFDNYIMEEDNAFLAYFGQDADTGYAEAWNREFGMPDGVELHTDANAASDPNGNEANATTGFTARNSTLTSDSTITDVGSYSL